MGILGLKVICYIIFRVPKVMEFCLDNFVATLIQPDRTSFTGSDIRLEAARVR